MRRVSIGALVAVLCVLLPAMTRAQTPFPTKPVRLVVPFVAGGSADVLARITAQHLTTLWAQPVIVDNRPGSGGHIGAELVARAPGDGYTILLGAIGIHAAHSIYRKLTYDPSTDLQPLVLLADFPNVIIVHPSVPVHSIKELIAYAGEHPGEINFGSAGSGSSTHMIGELFMAMSGVKLTHIPYRGSAAAMNDLLGGQIQAMFENLPTALPNIASGKLRALGVTAAQRVPTLPDVPTVAEAGVPGYEATAWFTIATASTVPAPLVDKINADLRAILARPDVVEQFGRLGATPMGRTPDEARSFIAAETEKWGGLVQKAGIHAD